MTTPTAETILLQLCNFDPRHPDYADMMERYAAIEMDFPALEREGCACNNCFYGRAPLASALLAMIGERA